MIRRIDPPIDQVNGEIVEVAAEQARERICSTDPEEEQCDADDKQGEATGAIMGSASWIDRLIFFFWLMRRVVRAAGGRHHGVYYEPSSLESTVSLTSVTGQDSVLTRTQRQAFAVLLPVKSVGVMGDEGTYENASCVRAVTSTDGMTADWAHLPHDVLGRISNRIINEVRGINRTVYDITARPSDTIEWE